MCFVCIFITFIYSFVALKKYPQKVKHLFKDNEIFQIYVQFNIKQNIRIM